MALFFTGLGTLVGSGVMAALCYRRATLATRVAVTGAIFGAGLVLVPALPTLFGGGTLVASLPWSMPGAALRVGLDPLAALFVVPMAVLGVLAAIYGARYLDPAHANGTLGVHWLAFNTLIASMLLVVVAQNGVLFLLAWEVMSLSSFVLVLYDGSAAEVRRAAWVYLVATHLGTACLLAFFTIFGAAASSFDFDAMRASATAVPAGLLFVLALIGFGTKAGFMPFHVWLPEAHPAAPSHVSALMSGVMIKSGIYGLLRALTLFGPPPAWWGFLLLSIGVTSAVLGIVLALAQHDLKRLLAYCSVENIGIIAVGVGLGLLGKAYGLPVLTALGFGGALLHVVNHAIAKGLLFFGAGAVLHATDTRDLNRLGGLLCRMPLTGATFCVGSAAICGLPPFGAFVSELLLYSAAFVAGTTGSPALVAAAAIAITGLALGGGFAAACFAKAFGIAFLGEPRSAAAAAAHEVGTPLTAVMLVLSVAAALSGVLAPWVVGSLAGAVANASGTSLNGTTAGLGVAVDGLFFVSLAAGILIAVVLVLTLTRWLLLRRRPIGATGTWDCGYARPSPRMQYTASSFAAPLVELFQGVLRTHRRFTPPVAIFPPSATLSTHTPDTLQELLYAPIFVGISNALASFRPLQHGRVQLYVLYIAVTLGLLLLWSFQ
ncbi:MAG: hypothetical protein HY903_06635 [Deltaproteobacteria bacterium]|nr:hypothetical protein [Deltaproteobacteria bacterium]